MPGYIHHIQWSVANRAQMVSRLAETWGAEVVAGRELETVLRLGSTTFLVSQKQQEEEGERPSSPSSPSYPYLQCCQGKVCPHSQSVFNICLEVEDVAGTVERMEREGLGAEGGGQPALFDREAPGEDGGGEGKDDEAGVPHELGQDGD